MKLTRLLALLLIPLLVIVLAFTVALWGVGEQETPRIDRAAGLVGGVYGFYITIVVAMWARSRFKRS